MDPLDPDNPSQLVELVEELLGLEGASESAKEEFRERNELEEDSVFAIVFTEYKNTLYKKIRQFLYTGNSKCIIITRFGLLKKRLLQTTLRKAKRYTEPEPYARTDGKALRRVEVLAVTTEV